MAAAGQEVVHALVLVLVLVVHVLVQVVVDKIRILSILDLQCKYYHMDTGESRFDL